MRLLVHVSRIRLPVLMVGSCLVLGYSGTFAQAVGTDSIFGSSSYAQHGPGPAYAGAYSDYGGNANGLAGRFSAGYGEFGAVPGYVRFGSGSSYGTGPLQASGTGKGARADTAKAGNSPHQPPAPPAPDRRSELFP